MSRLVRALLSLSLLLQSFLFAADRVLVAEGGYVALTQDGSKPVDHWKLWREPGGELTAEVSAVLSGATAKGGLSQNFYFDQHFVPSGYSVDAQVDDERMVVTCRRQAETLTCETKFEGKWSTATAKSAQPCVVMLDEFSGIDLPWLMTGMVRITETSKNPGPVAVYVITENDLGTITLQPDSGSNDFKAVGEEEIQLLGKKQKVRAYEWGSPDVRVVKILPNGLVGAINPKGKAGAGFELADYKEYVQLE